MTPDAFLKVAVAAVSLLCAAAPGHAATLNFGFFRMLAPPPLPPVAIPYPVASK